MQMLQQNYGLKTYLQKHQILFDYKINEISIINNAFYFDSINDNIKTVDISMCESLTRLEIGNITKLETIKTSQLNQSLSVIALSYDQDLYSQLKELNFSNLTSLSHLSYWNSDTKKIDLFETLDISNNPELAVVIVNNTNLKTVTSKNNYAISDLQINNNNLSEINLLNLIDSLPRDSIKGGLRQLSIYGNPGNTAKVKEAGNKLTYWDIDYEDAE